MEAAFPNGAELLDKQVRYITYITFFDCLLNLSGLRVLRCPPTYKTDRHDITEISLKVALNTISHQKTWVGPSWCDRMVYIV